MSQRSPIHSAPGRSFILSEFQLFQPDQRQDIDLQRLDQVVLAGGLVHTVDGPGEIRHGLQDYFRSICEDQRMKPQVIQLECNIYAQRKDMREKIKPYDIQLECWFPLGGAMGVHRLSQDPVIQQIAQAHGKSAVQTMLRWHIQEGFSVIPGSKDPDHIKENINIFDFELSEAEMNRIRALDKATRTLVSSYDSVEQRQRTRRIDDL